ncbi:Asp-tRNA(Asn)/Glu-tRNA(Gln) amidotransferase subunit GatB [Thiotrichales bacterium 19S11-10]|nr:Asp-tRNA(Asn)/Glu-tRNA(Gln) amidotransferase subunit GatB [Thiotrichales bacterium 19S11-10]MCF6808203.1 Asp-tRNA(Asn)/Glu-tRNA(Gln) amidotransferase subunit GatB [Thiotrichales bacterium 19S9-11]MCF6812219.1 Asp-tRNA(Asn)/Glu-tRNA(Gln) amidotransferase subunit GatB [Thiotrichales bacterium 19S9-12]
MDLNHWETVIGLEVHTQLRTKSKLFSGASAAYGASPNTQACAIDIALPGVLPVLNKDAVKMAIKFGLAVDAAICKDSVFARKNYFYPDLPKGYQISQYDKPIVGVGHLDIILDDGRTKRIGITRAHLEEDAGKSLHEDFQGQSGIDLNRSGVPLLEIVSEPDMRSAKEAITYLKTLHTLVRYLDISDGNMQEGSFRCDVNVSVRPKGQVEFGTRAEIKNINSFRFVERAIHYEVERQIALIESGQPVIQETRLYDATKNETRSMRNKEDAHDYRYFPDPDLLPAVFDDTFINDVAKTMPELPEEKRQRLMSDYALSAYDASVLVSSRALSDYYENVVKKTSDAKLTANWVMGDLAAMLNKENLTIKESKVSDENLALLINRIKDNTISGRIAKEVFESMWESGEAADQIIESKGLKQITDNSALESMVDEIINNNPTQLEQYKSGKTKLFGYFVGQVMKASQGKANPQQINTILKEKLEKA